MALDDPGQEDQRPAAAEALARRFFASRARSEALAAAFTPEDWMLQSMEAASPIKWNLAHTSWFYETFVLEPHAAGFAPFDPAFAYLFNSYYQQVGAMHPRPARGLISRPSAERVLQYRAHVTARVADLLAAADAAALSRLAPLIDLGVAHEEQHQELLLTDIQHALYQNPLSPAAYEREGTAPSADPGPLIWRDYDPGLVMIGHDDEGFAFDNEGPQHKVMLQPFGLAERLVTNADYLAFMQDGGYDDPRWWLADGWATAEAEGWRAPLYWREEGGVWRTYSLYGEAPIDPHAPVCHLSYYEASAYAEWTGFRLPVEAEWEFVAALTPVEGNLLAGDRPRPPRGGPSDTGAPFDINRPPGPRQLFGDVWEWTASPYVAYPGYRTPPGAIGEYNGKFMSSQMVLRGGSCATPEGHIRATYRNFFPPGARWQFAGLRLARDLG